MAKNWFVENILPVYELGKIFYFIHSRSFTVLFFFLFLSFPHCDIFYIVLLFPWLLVYLSVFPFIFRGFLFIYTCLCCLFSCLFIFSFNFCWFDLDFVNWIIIICQKIFKQKRKAKNCSWWGFFKTKDALWLS